MTMELTASRRPFPYVPLARHLEQNYQVRHRPGRYRPGGARTTRPAPRRYRRRPRAASLLASLR